MTKKGMQLVHGMDFQGIEKAKFGGNPILLIRFYDGTESSAIRQGTLNFWACKERLKMTDDEQKYFDLICNDQFEVWKNKFEAL